MMKESLKETRAVNKNNLMKKKRKINNKLNRECDGE